LEKLGPFREKNVTSHLSSLSLISSRDIARPYNTGGALRGCSPPPTFSRSNFFSIFFLFLPMIRPIYVYLQKKEHWDSSNKASRRTNRWKKFPPPGGRNFLPPSQIMLVRPCIGGILIWHPQKIANFQSPFTSPSTKDNNIYIYCFITIESANTWQILRPPPSPLCADV
jgi:hypothetical protein